MKLYELKNDYLILLQKFREAEDEQQLAEIADDLASLKDDIETKLDGCARVFRTLEAESEVYQQEANRLKGKANVLANRAERLREYVGQCLGVGNKAKTALFDFSWRKSEAVEIDREDLIPDVYKRTTVVTEPNKIVIKQDLKGGAEIPGVRLVERFNLQIK